MIEWYKRLDLRLSILELQLADLIRVQSLAETAVNEFLGGLPAWYEERRMVVDDDEDSEDRAALDAEFKELAEGKYLQVVRTSLLTIAYASFENFMVQLCKSIEPLHGGLNLDELHGQGIKRAHLYLSKVARIKIPQSKAWEDLTNYGLLRNVIAHALGDVAGYDKITALQNFASRVKTFNISDADTVNLEETCLSHFVQTVRVFSQQLEAVWPQEPH